MFSTRNCPTSVRDGAPNALRTPISDARSMIRLMLMFTRLTVGDEDEQQRQDEQQPTILHTWLSGSFAVGRRHQAGERPNLVSNGATIAS